MEYSKKNYYQPIPKKFSAIQFNGKNFSDVYSLIEEKQTIKFMPVTENSESHLRILWTDSKIGKNNYDRDCRALKGDFIFIEGNQLKAASESEFFSKFEIARS